MQNKIIYLIKYTDSPNIWDNFQTLSTKNVLEKIWYTISYVDRDRQDTDLEKLIFVNGYYSPKTIKTLNLEYSDKTKVIFFNIHLAIDNWRLDYVKNSFLNNKKIYSSFKRFEPIGCRDESTKSVLNSVGINAINNECITLLMDKRSKEQEKNAKKLILVDVDEFIPMPKWYNKENIEYKTQVRSDRVELSNDEKLNLSKELLDYYKNNAKLIITSRFHCAMPCIAMWIPVVFLGDSNSKRCEWLWKYITIYNYIHFWRRTITQLKKLSWSDNIPLLNKKIKYDFNSIDVIYNILYKLYINLLYLTRIRKINWDVKMPNIEKQKQETIISIKEQIKKKG